MKTATEAKKETTTTAPEVAVAPKTVDTKPDTDSGEPLPEQSAEATADKQGEIGTSVGKADEHAKYPKEGKNPVEKNQKSPAHQPSVEAVHNTSVVNPIAPPVEPTIPGDYAIRQQATPTAFAEPTEFTQAQQRVSQVIDDICEHHNVDMHQKALYKKQAGL